MKGNLNVEISVTNIELLKELGRKLGIDYHYMYIEKGIVMNDEGRYPTETDINPEIFKAYEKIYQFLKNKEER